jgi:hypothetical protein
VPRPTDTVDRVVDKGRLGIASRSCQISWLSECRAERPSTRPQNTFTSSERGIWYPAFQARYARNRYIRPERAGEGCASHSTSIPPSVRSRMRGMRTIANPSQGQGLSKDSQVYYGTAIVGIAVWVSRQQPNVAHCGGLLLVLLCHKMRIPVGTARRAAGEPGDQVAGEPNALRRDRRWIMSFRPRGESPAGRNPWVPERA